MHRLHEWGAIDLQRSKDQYSKVNLSCVLQTANRRLTTGFVIVKLRLLLLLLSAKIVYFQVKFILLGTSDCTEPWPTKAWIVQALLYNQKIVILQ